MSAEVDFSNRPVKREIELFNSKLTTQKGGWFGLTADQFLWHYNAYKHNLRKNSPFFVVDYDYNITNAIKKQVAENNLSNVVVKTGDLFDCLKKVGHYNVPLFSFGHLDFCRTALTLCRDEQLIENLYWLAKWDNLKDTFFFDITFAVRGDHASMYISMLEFTIPQIFMSCGWQVYNTKRGCISYNDNCEEIYSRSLPYNPKVEVGNFMHEYREKRCCGMVNAFYKVVRK